MPDPVKKKPSWPRETVEALPPYYRMSAELLAEDGEIEIVEGSQHV